MKSEHKRIFISDLPETASPEEIESAFSEYGKVSSVEIKNRKELGPKNTSLFFSYVNIEINDRDLQKCFKDFANTLWHGQYLQLQVARESFLDRLKREREGIPKDDNNKVVSNEEIIVSGNETPIKKTERNSEIKVETKRKKERVTIEKEKPESSNNNSHEIENKLSKGIFNIDPDIIIKNNKDKLINKNGLKINSLGKEPIVIINNEKKKIPINQSEANLKRLDSLKTMKMAYQAQKSAIKAALSSVDVKPKNKIIFDDNNEQEYSRPPLKENSSTKNLFDEDDEDDFNGNFTIKEQFSGNKGKELLKLQSKYQNDERFQLNERFIENDEGDDSEKSEDEIDEDTIEYEKRKELEILNQVLGKPVGSKSLHKNDKQSKKKAMLRFDPNQPQHVNFEVQKVKDNADEKIVKKRKIIVDEISQENPVVSKEVFYKVTDDLKETFQEKQEFSLLSMFGKLDEKNEQSQEPYEKPEEISRYDSSDDEDETDDIPHINDDNSSSRINKSESRTGRSKMNLLWNEPLLFKNDDYRLQEGFEFLEKIKESDKDFSKVRRDLKGIVKSKIKNNERKNRMFRRKIGGGKGKRRKDIRMNKALKR